MKNLLITLGVIVVILGGLFLWGSSKYNGFVTAEEGVDTEWSNVESQYQRRLDLVPNLVSTVKGYASHEKTTLEGVVEARAKATSTTISVDDLDEATLKKYQAAQGELSQALGRLLAITENYPDLKANENFLELQEELSRTENRINVARMRYNEVAKTFNTAIRRFPANMIASMFGFDKKPYFQAEAGAEKAPKVEF